MRRLRDFQIVALQVSEARATCRVIAVEGGQAVVEPASADQLAGADLPGAATLAFETGRHPVLLSGMAAPGPLPGTVRFRVTDAVGVPEARLRPRLAAELEIHLTPLDAAGRPAGPAIVRTTVDVSAGGVLVAGHWAPAGAPAAVELRVPGLPRPLRCTARAVRQLPQGCALRFEDLDDGVRTTLDRLIFTVRRQVARRAFAAAAQT